MKNLTSLNNWSLFVFLLFWNSFSFCAESDDSISVYTQRFSTIAVYPENSAPAVIVSLNNSDIATPIDALVRSVPVRVGDKVAAGEVLVQLDCRDFESERARLLGERKATQARLELSAWQLKQTKILAGQQTLSEEQVQKKRAEHTALQGDLAALAARLKATARQIAACRVKAPYAGVVTARLTGVGQYAARGDALIRLLDVTDTEISAQVPSREADALLNAGQLAFERDGKRFPLTLRTILPAIQTETASQEVRLNFSAERDEAGAGGRLMWRNRHPFLPANVIVKRGDLFGVFIATNGRARFQALPGAQSGRPAPTPLPLESTVIVSGQFALQDGQAIRAQPLSDAELKSHARNPGSIPKVSIVTGSMQ